MVLPSDLAALSKQAAALLDEAKQFKAKLDMLPPGDPNRPELEGVIRRLLDSANSISDVVKSSVGKP